MPREGAWRGAWRGAWQRREVRLLLVVAAVGLSAFWVGGALIMTLATHDADADAASTTRSPHESSSVSTSHTTHQSTTFSSFSHLCKYINCSGLAPTTKTILLWNPPTPEDNLGYGPSKGNNIFQDVSCRPNDCFMTSNRSLMPTSSYDAVVIYNTPPVTRSISKKRRREQRYIFYMPQPPLLSVNDRIYNMLTILPKYYNWTMSYLADSDIPFPRAQVEPGPGPRGWLWPAAPPPDPEKFASTPLRPPERGLSKNPVRVAFFNEFCHAVAVTRAIVRGLKRFMRVDEMGRCEDLTWPDQPDPARALVRNYDFYLLIVDEGCRDYATEKLYDYLQLDILTVVSGSDNFSAALPPHSFINVGDFRSTSHLARYLLYLARHPTEYAKFSWWKSHYRLVRPPPANLCRLCEKLLQPEPPKAYVSAWKHWHGEYGCGFFDGRVFP